MLSFVNSCIDHYPLVTIGIKNVYARDQHGNKTETIIDYKVDFKWLKLISYGAGLFSFLSLYFRLPIRIMELASSIFLGIALSTGVETWKAARQVNFMSAEALRDFPKPSVHFARNVLLSLDAAKYAKQILKAEDLTKPLQNLFLDQLIDEQEEVEDQADGVVHALTFRSQLGETYVDARVRQIFEMNPPENA